MHSMKVFWVHFAVHYMPSACNFHQNMIFFLGNMWIQIIKHFNWQLFTITGKGITGPGNSQIIKAKCPKLPVTEVCHQFLDYPVMFEVYRACLVTK